MPSRVRSLVLSGLAALLLAGAAWAQEPQNAPNLSDWQNVERSARDQTVRLAVPGAPAGALRLLEWAGDELSRLHGVTLQVETGGTVADGFSPAEGGSGPRADLVWIEGDDLPALRAANRLGPPFANQLPNWLFVDVANQPSVLTDASVPVDGQALPWGAQKLTFFADTARAGPADTLPRTFDAVLEWAEAHRGRFALPDPRNLVGRRFLEQVLFEVADDPSVLGQPTDNSDFEAVTAPLWPILEQLARASRDEGRSLAANEADALGLLQSGEADMVLGLDPLAAAAAIKMQALPTTVRPFTLDGGTIGGTHFLAIPADAPARAGALVVANFLASPQAQARKADLSVWGDPSVLDIAAVPEGLRDALRAPSRDPAALSGRALGLTVAEPHPSWGDRLVEGWQRRHAQ